MIDFAARGAHVEKKRGLLVVLCLLMVVPALGAQDPVTEGVYCLSNGQFSEARQAFATAVRKDPSRALAVAGLGAVHLFAGEFEQSLSSFAAALQLSPNSVWPDACLGAAYLAMGDHRRAADHFNRCLAQRPHWSAVRGRLAYALWREKLFSAALESASVARACGDDTFAPLVEARVLMELGDFSRAYQALPQPDKRPQWKATSALLPAPMAGSSVETAAEPSPSAAFAISVPERQSIRFVWPRQGCKVSGRVEVQLAGEAPFQYIVLYVDDQFLAVSNVVSYRAVWESWRWPDGAHRLRVEGYGDSGHRVAWQEIEVIVANRKRSADATQAARDNLMGQQLAELCLPDVAPHEVYILRSQAAQALALWPQALDAAEQAFCFWPWEKQVREVILEAYASLGVRRELGQEIHVVPHDGEVALTFDDGPHPRVTPLLMRVLAQRRLRATFFLVGKQALLYPHLVRDLVNAGHEIGSHSHTHQNMAELSALDVERELVESRWAIARACGRRVILFRPPGGHYSDIMRNAVAAYGFRPVFWTANISRYAKRPYAEVIAGLMEDLRDGGILLLHNGDDETPYIIEELLNRLLAAGHRIGPIGELSGMPQPYFATGGSLGR